MGEFEESEALLSSSKKNEYSKDKWENEEPVSKNIAYYSLFTLTYINILNYCERYVIAGMKSMVKEDLSLTDAETSFPVTAFIIVYMLASPVFAYLSDTNKLSKKKILMISICIWCFFATLSATATNFWHFLIIRALVGIGEAGYSTISVVLLSEYFGEKKRNLAIGIYQLAIPVGAGFGFFFGSFFSTIVGWRYTFILSGILASTSLIFLLFLPECKTTRQISYPQSVSSSSSSSSSSSYNHYNHGSQEKVDNESGDSEVNSKRAQNEEENHHHHHRQHSESLESYGSVMLMNEEEDNEMKKEERGNVDALKEIVCNVEWMMAAMGVTAVSFVAGGMADWFPTYLMREKDLTQRDAGIICSASVILSGIIGTICGSALVELHQFIHNLQYSKYKFSFLVPALGLIPAIMCLFILFVYNIELREVIILLFISQFFLWFYSGPVTSLLVELVPHDVRSRAMSVSIILFHVLGDAISPPIIGVISDRTGSLSTALSIIPSVLIVAALCWFLGLVKFSVHPHYLPD